MLKCYVWSVLLYGAETWTISKAMQKKLEATEMWFLRRMLKIAWTEKKTNEEILNEIGIERSLIVTIKKRQLSFFGHMMRKEGLEHLAITGKVEGKRARGRQRNTYVDCLREGIEGVRNNIELIRGCQDRAKWKSMVANVEIHST